MYKNMFEHLSYKDNNVLPESFVDKIICWGSLDVLKMLPDNCIDLVFTSPPYNLGMDYDVIDDNQDFDEYFNILFKIFDEVIRVTKYGGRIAINIAPFNSKNIPTHHMISNYFLQRGLIWFTEVIWEKNNYNSPLTAWGSWKSPSQPYFKTTWEYIEIFAKGTKKHKGDRDNIDITKEGFMESVLAKWSIAPENKMKKYGHPAMFPEKLADRVLKILSFKNDVILDPFNGAGTTTLVSHKTDRRYLGIDISETYCDIAKNRIKEYEQQ